MKKVRIVAQNLPESFGFSIGERFVRLTDLTVEDAELIAAQHEGYVELIDETENDTNRTELTEAGDESQPQPRHRRSVRGSEG